MSPHALAQVVASLTGCRDADEAVEIVRPGAGRIHRLGVGLEAWDGVAGWLAERELDGVILHRVRSPHVGGILRSVAVLGCHDPFDRHYGFGDCWWLRDALGASRIGAIGDRDGHPLGTVERVPDGSFAELCSTLRGVFGEIEHIAVTSSDEASVRYVVVARAMTAALVQQAAAAGADAYITGELRMPGLEPARAAGLPVIAIGHRRAERLMLQRFAADLEGATALAVVAHPGQPETRAI